MFFRQFMITLYKNHTGYSTFLYFNAFKEEMLLLYEEKGC